MTYKEIITELKNKIYRPVYLLTGDEPFYIDLISNNISENVLDENEKSFNQTVLYGKETDVNTLITLARRYPMMSNYQVVILKEAQELKDFDNLIHYVENPLKSTILVINYKYKKLDKRKKVCKVIDEKGILFESNKLYDDKIPGWISSYVKAKGYSIDVNSTMLLFEYLGNDLSKIVNEIDKLLIVIPEDTKKINAPTIEKYIGISKDYNNFELQNALIQKNKLKAYKIVKYFSQNQKNNPVNLTIIVLYNFFSKVIVYYFIKDKSPKNVASILKINPYFVKDYEMASKKYSPKKLIEIISALREYDLRSKGVNNVSTPPGDLLKELVTIILN
ncbi:MAG: DNA polymerase III subunit delta [Bacteroidales bacterium]|nr:DNA polymerase III subunit delta [Bacteroidales bacterium]